jgi:hypothetical protein
MKICIHKTHLEVELLCSCSLTSKVVQCNAMKFTKNLMHCVHLEYTKTLWENCNSPWWNVKGHYVDVHSMSHLMVEPLSVVTLTLGSWPRQRGYKVAGQEEARESRQEKARESHHTLTRVLESVRGYEGVNPHNPKVTPTLGDGVPKDSQNFREQFQGSKLNSLWHPIYHWKALRM